MTPSILDGIIFGLVCFGVWRGYVAGVIREAAQLFGTFAAFAIALTTMKPVGIYVVSVISVIDLPPEGGALVAFVLVFVLVYLVVYLTARILERFAQSVKLGLVNKIFGGAFGAAKSLLIVSVILIFLGQLGIPKEESQKSSYLYHSVIEKIEPQHEIWAATGVAPGRAGA